MFEVPVRSIEVGLFVRCLQSSRYKSDAIKFFPLQPAAMAQKILRILGANGDQRVVSVLDTTTIRQIVQQCDEGSVQDFEGALLRGVTRLEPDMTVSEAGLEDGEEISLIWFDPFDDTCVEMAHWTGEAMGNNLYVRIPPHVTSIENCDSQLCDQHRKSSLSRLLLPDKSKDPKLGDTHSAFAFQWLQILDTCEHPRLCKYHF